MFKSVVVPIAASLLMLSGSVALAQTQQTIAVGDAAVDGRFIQEYRNSWRLVGRGSDGSVVEMGTWTDQALIANLDGRDVIIRHQMWIHDRGAEGYFNVLDHHTLAPIISQYTNAGGMYRRLEYAPDGRLVHYQFSPQPSEQGLRLSAPMTRGDIDVAAPMFDFNTGTFGLLLLGFPLQEGYSARFPVFRSYDPSAEPAWVNFEVTGRETVPAGARGTMDTWRIVAHSPDTEETMIFNLSQEPPYIIRLQQEWEGRDWTFEMM